MDFSLLTIKIYIENWLGGLAANWDYAQVILPSLLHGTVTTIQVFFVTLIFCTQLRRLSFRDLSRRHQFYRPGSV